MPSDLTQLLLSWSHGDEVALYEVVPVLHDELKRMTVVPMPCGAMDGQID